MKTVILGDPPESVAEFLARRRELGQDGYDEVWEGVYYVAPMAHPWHGDVQAQLTRLLGPYADGRRLILSGPFNLGDGPDDFRVPDLGCFHYRPADLYMPSAALVVEVMSPGDETMNKFGFYAAHRVEEVAVADYTNRTLRWWRLDPDGYEPVSVSPLLNAVVEELASQIRWPGQG